MSKVTEVIGPDRILSAVGQGAIGVEIRAGDASVAGLVSVLDHRDTRLSVAAERALLRRLEGGCQVPIGALGRLQGARLRLDGLVADLDGRSLFRGTEEGAAPSEEAASEIGRRLAERLLDMGARAILERILATARPQTPHGAGTGEEA